MKPLSLQPYRRAAVPLLAVQTADPAGIVRLARREAVNGTTAPLLVWDCIHGIVAGNDEARELADWYGSRKTPAAPAPAPETPGGVEPDDDPAPPPAGEPLRRLQARSRELLRNVCKDVRAGNRLVEVF